MVQKKHCGKLCECDPSDNGCTKALWDCDLQTMALYNCCLNLHIRQWFCLVFNKPLSELQAV